MKRGQQKEWAMLTSSEVYARFIECVVKPMRLLKERQEKAK